MGSVRDEIKFLLRHSSIYGIGNILSKLVAFLLLPLYTHYLTPADYGILELVSVTTGIIGIVVGVGIAEAMSRFYYEQDQEHERARVVSTVYVLAFAVTGVSVLILTQTTPFFASLILDSEQYRGFFTLSFLILACGIIVDVGVMYLRLRYHSVLVIIMSVAGLVIGVSLNVFFIVFMGYGVKGILWSGFITNLVVGIPLTIGILSAVGIGFNRTLGWEMLRYSLPLIPSSIARALVGSSDRYFIKHFLSIADAGIYALANKLGMALHLLITSPFIMTFLPRRFEIVREHNSRDVFRRLFDYYVLAFLAAGLTLSVFIDEIMMLMTTPNYYRAGALVPLVVLSLLVFGMKYHFEFGILYAKKTAYYAYINVGTAIVHLALNLFLIQMFGLMGAVIASLASTGLNTILVYAVGSALFRIRFDFARTAKTLAAGVLIFALSRYPVTESLALTIGYKVLLMGAFPLTLMLLRALTEGEIAAVKKLPAMVFVRPRWSK